MTHRQIWSVLALWSLGLAGVGGFADTPPAPPDALIHDPRFTNPWTAVAASP